MRKVFASCPDAWQAVTTNNMNSFRICLFVVTALCLGASLANAADTSLLITNSRMIRRLNEFLAMFGRPRGLCDA